MGMSTLAVWECDFCGEVVQISDEEQASPPWGVYTCQIQRRVLDRRVGLIQPPRQRVPEYQGVYCGACDAVLKPILEDLPALLDRLLNDAKADG